MGLFEETAERFPDQDFIVSPGERFTYKETKEKVLQVAKGLAAIGVKPGEHVAMQIENCPEQVFVALAVNAIGAVKVPVNIFPFLPEKLGFCTGTVPVSVSDHMVCSY